MAWLWLVAASVSQAATISFSASIEDGTLLKSTTGTNLNGEVRFGVFWNQNALAPSFLTSAQVGSLWSSTPAASRFSTLQASFLSICTNTIAVTNGTFSFTGSANNEYDSGIDDGAGGTLLVSLRDLPIFAFISDSFTSPNGMAVLSTGLVTVGDDGSFNDGATTWGLTFNDVTDEYGTLEPTATTLVGTNNGSPISSVQLASLPAATTPAPPTLRLLTVGTPAYTNGNTVVTHTFAGNTNATYVFEYKSSLAAAWQTNTAVVGSSANFAVTFTNNGVNSTNDWKNRMFFRVKNG